MLSAGEEGLGSSTLSPQKRHSRCWRAAGARAGLRAPEAFVEAGGALGLLGPMPRPASFLDSWEARAGEGVGWITGWRVPFPPRLSLSTYNRKDFSSKGSTWVWSPEPEAHSLEDLGVLWLRASQNARYSGCVSAPSDFSCNTTLCNPMDPPVHRVLQSKNTG